ncbi:MAG TPA: CGNR zinc finger domain-containing protein [Actinoplanes sp.]|nr:CGNR zinc finger domain-containing protein [Actinoplanes sp.]
METPPLPPGIRTLPIVAGHVALDFANTVDDPLGPLRFDHVATYPALLAWSSRVGTLSPEAADDLLRAAGARPRGAAAVVGRAATLRTRLNDTFGALVDGSEVAPLWPGLRAFVADALAHAGLTGSPPVPTWENTGLETPLWPVAEAAYRLLTGSELARLKRCAGCPWLFLDQSRNGSRRWCAMDDCGKHEKIRRYVTKRAASRRR